MTDILKGFAVVLEHPMREDDAETIKNAILAIRGVADVIPAVNTAEDTMVEVRVRRELQTKLIAFLD